MTDDLYLGLRLRKHADRSGPEPPYRLVPQDDGTVTRERDPWPLLGLEVLDAPARVKVPTSFVARGRAEGWITVEGERPVHRPAGPADDPWRATHTFVHLDAFTIHTLDGLDDVTYRVTHQPDKYDDETGEPSDNAGDPTTHVDHFYLAEKEA